MYHKAPALSSNAFLVRSTCFLAGRECIPEQKNMVAVVFLHEQSSSLFYLHILGQIICLNLRFNPLIKKQAS